jgi:hypothetical protein
MSDVIKPTLVPPVETSASPVEVSVSPGATTENTPEGPSPSGLHDPAGTPPLATPPADSEAEKRKARGRPFERGRSGNPNGRPKGSRNHITRAVQDLIDAKAEELVAKAIEKGLKGDSGMQRVLLSRVIPAQRERMVELDLPPIETPAEAPAASAAVLSACSSGDISPSEADAIMGLIKAHVQNIQASDLEARVAALEIKQRK